MRKLFTSESVTEGHPAETHFLTMYILISDLHSDLEE